MTRPLTIVSQRHPLAVVVYAVMVVLGVCYQVGAASARALTTLMGPWSVGVWAAAMTAFGVCALVGLILPVRLTAAALLVEATGALALFLLNGVYVVSLLSAFGSAVIVTELAFGFLAIGFLARAIQAFRERGRVALAQAHPLPASPSPLAEPEQSTRRGR